MRDSTAEKKGTLKGEVKRYASLDSTGGEEIYDMKDLGLYQEFPREGWPSSEILVNC